MQFRSVSNFGSSQIGLNNSNFIFSNNALSFLSDSTIYSGVSLADSSVLFILRFHVRGNNGLITPILFTNSPTPFQVSNSTNINLHSYFIQGSCNIQCNNLNIYQSVCSNQTPYLWNNHPYFTTGAYPITYTSSSGIDSTVTLNLVVNESSYDSVYSSICRNELPFLWNGNNYDSSGIYVWAGVNYLGCDSF